MATFSGKLNANEIYTALFNMIISQEVFSDNIKGTDLVDQARVDGSLYGDTKLYYSTGALQSYDWKNDQEAANLLNLHRPDAPECQSITLDQFRMIPVTTDEYLSKRAWGTESAFSSFNSVTLGWLRDTKKIIDATTYNAYIGTTVSEAVKGTLTVTSAVAADGAQLAEALADLTTELCDYNEDYNDYGQLRRYDESDIKIIFNASYVNRIKNVDLPVIFNNSGLKAVFDKEVLPAKYFGSVNATATAGDGSTVRALVEQTIGSNHYFPGQLIATGDTAAAGESYTEDSKIIAKICIKGKLPPFMSAFEAGTSFWNPRALTTTNYLIWGRNTLEYLKAYPFITVKSE